MGKKEETKSGRRTRKEAVYGGQPEFLLRISGSLLSASSIITLLLEAEMSDATTPTSFRLKETTG